MKNLYILIPVIAMVALTGPGKSRAERVHKWLDADGQVHFSDRAPLNRETETADITPSSGKGKAGIKSGLRTAERRLLGISRQRENEILQARRRSVSTHAAGKSRCRTARDRYDRAKRKPGSARSALVRSYYEEMKERCR